MCRWDGGGALSTGPAPTPYHVYDGHGLLLVGTCDAAALADGFAGQDVHPVRTASGQGVLLLFICDFREASHGPHLEFHVTALAAPEADQRLGDDPAEALAALATRKDWGVLSLHLWNDADNVVAYNTEYLGLQAMRADGRIDVSAGQVDFAFSTPEAGPIAQGSVGLAKRSDAHLMRRVLRYLGWRGLWDAMRRKPSVAHVVNRKSEVITHNGRAQTRTAPDKMIVSAFDAARDQMDLDQGPLAQYGFEPKIVEHLWPFRFVYLHPDAT